MSDLTDRAEQMLEGITPGPWDFNEWPDQTTIDNGEGVVVAALPSCLRTNSEADTRFIAAAPQLVADLIAEVKRLTPREIQHQEVSVYAALPIGSVVMDARRDVYERWTDGWVVTDLAETEYQDDGDMDFPLAVLYVPEVQS